MTHVSRRNPLRRIGLFALIVAVQFALFEAALRTWGSSEAAPAFQGLFADDPVVGYRLKPGARTRFTTSEFDTELAVNASGVRDDEAIGPKAPDERRILLLGDSLVLAVQVPFRQTFGELLEQRLNSRGSRVHYRVINAGVQGYGPVQELLLCRSLLPVVKPDLIIDTLFVGNDIEDAVSGQALLEGRQRAISVREATTMRLRRLVRRSMVLQVFRVRALTATGRFTRTAAPPEPPLQSYASDPAPRIAQGLSIIHRVVQQIDQEGRASGARTAVMLMPARFQVNDEDYGHLRDAVSQAGGILVRDAAGERIDGALRDLPVPRFDALPALRAAGADAFFLHTVHLTPRGHEVVAAALERFLRESRLLDGF
ncbi:MAG: SGNH/GDSL hydrolase family protein [Vicinamibacterales bacterium]